jgi:hypothetical protein
MSSYNTTNSVNGVVYSNWLADLLQVIEIDSWFQEMQNITDSTHQNRPTNSDFDVRSRTLDLILYLYVKSTSDLELHAALFMQKNHTSYLNSSNL